MATAPSTIRLSTLLKSFFIICLSVFLVCAYADTRPQWRIVQLINESLQIEFSCARDFGINKQMFRALHSPMKLAVMHQPAINVKCFTRCICDRYGYYSYRTREFDFERLVEVSTAIGFPEDLTRRQADRCRRVAWLGEEDCDDFWNVYRCFQGSV